MLLLTVPHCTVVRYCMFPSHFCVMVTLGQNLWSERNYMSTNIFPIFQKDFIYWQSKSKTETFLLYNLLPRFYNSILGFHDSILDFYNSILAFYNSILAFFNSILAFYNSILATVGDRQECLLSPTLFNNFLERIVCEAWDGHEGSVSIGGRPITNFRFADDIVVNAEEEEEAGVLIDRLDRTTTRYKWR